MSVSKSMSMKEVLIFYTLARWKMLLGAEVSMHLRLNLIKPLKTRNHLSELLINTINDYSSILALLIFLREKHSSSNAFFKTLE